MTREEILNMPAGDKCDELIARYIGGNPDLCYSTDIMCALDLFKPGWYLSMAQDKTWAILVKYSFSLTLNPNQKIDLLAFADTAPLAICRAALISLDVTMWKVEEIENH